ncbi:MAG: hypothetical protein V1806_01865 [Pseudomonadota bacterium]
MKLSGIRTVDVTTNDVGDYKRVRLVFGPHYFVELQEQPDGKLIFCLGATHHGFKADASEIKGELERIIYDIRRAHPETIVD